MSPLVSSLVLAYITKRIEWRGWHEKHGERGEDGRKGLKSVKRAGRRRSGGCVKPREKDGANSSAPDLVGQGYDTDSSHLFLIWLFF